MAFYSIKNIKKTHSDINIVYGSKNTGKSFSIKEECIKEAIADPVRHKFIVLRRYADDIGSIRDCEDYFIDPNFNLEKISKGKYTLLKVKGSARIIYGANMVDGMLVTGEELGRMCALSTSEHYASKLRQGYSNIIFEEFQTRSTYLVNEVRLLMVFLSTVFGGEDGKVWLVGNAVSPVCPYYGDLGIEKLVAGQPAGTIRTHSHKWVDGLGVDHITKIAVEHTPDFGAKSNMIFGKHSKVVTGGGYETNEHPHLEKPLQHYDEVYNVLFRYNEHSFLMSYLIDKETSYCVWYVRPKTTDYRDFRIISNIPVSSPFWSYSFKPLNEFERRAFYQINLGHIAYCSNECGENFLQCYKQLLKEKGLTL